MPDGITHYKFYKMGWAVVLPTSIIVCAVKPEFGVGISVGYALGRWIDPDLDQIAITGAEGRVLHELGIFGKVFVAYSTLYGAVFYKHHRSFLTHFPGVSTSIRLGYFFWWLYFAIDILYDWEIWFGFGVFIGLSFADLIHYLLDKFYKLSPNSKHNQEE